LRRLLAWGRYSTQRETIVNRHDGGKLAQVDTAQRRMITRLKAGFGYGFRNLA